MPLQMPSSARRLLAFTLFSACVSWSQAQVSTKLSTPAPSSQAQKTYNLFVSLENTARNGGNKQTILGQHCEAQKEAYAGEYWVRVGNLAGKNPGFVEFDFGPGNYHATYQEPYVDNSVGFAKDRFTYSEGIAGFSFHMSYPGASVKSWENTFKTSSMNYAWLAKVINWQSNTIEYQNFLKDLSFAADKLTVLRDAGVPVLFRPLHEMNKAGSASPFWWANQDPAQYKQLWNIMHDYLVKTRGLNNLLFVWCPYEWDGTYGLSPFAYYPGSDRVDIVGVDIYHGNPYYPANYYSDLASYAKPRIIAECDKVPVRWADSFFSSVSEIDARPWVLVSIWGDTLLYNIGTTQPNNWNVANNYKGIKDSYNYYTTFWRTLSGGPNKTYNWGLLK